MNRNWSGTIITGGMMVAMVAGTAVDAVASTGEGEFDAGDFERERVEEAETWDWPEAAEFRERWDRLDEAAVPRVVLGDIRIEELDDDGWSMETVAEFEGSLIAITEGEFGAVAEGIQGPDPERDWRFHRAIRGLGELEPEVGIDDVEDGDELVYYVGGGKLVVDVEYVGDGGEILSRDWRDWVYVETLVSWGGSIYDDGPEKSDATGERSISELRPQLGSEDAAVRKQAVRELLNRPVDASAQVWADALDALEEGANDELKRKVYARYRPMGRCSMDTRPQRTAREYSEVCRRLGDLGCFLPLRIRVINNAFQRVARSSMGERAHEPDS